VQTVGVRFRGVPREQDPCEPATGNRPSGEAAALYPCGKIKSALSARIISRAWISHTTKNGVVEVRL
jgi:hypothetical protein